MSDSPSMNMEDKEITIENDDYIKLSRSIRTAYLDKLLTLDEMIVLIWLWINANPKIGRVMVSYDGLSKDFQSRYSKNHINKIMLALKRKKLMGFARQQGRRGSFLVDIQHYPLSSGGFKKLGESGKNNFGRSADATPPSKPTEIPAKDRLSWQKLNEGKKQLTEGVSMNQETDVGRSYKNDNDNRNYKDYRSQDLKSFKRIGFEDFSPQSYEEERCKEIARYLGEKDMTFILSAFKRYGFRVIEKIYIEIREREDSVDNKGAYFNTRVRQLAEEKYT